MDFDEIGSNAGDNEDGEALEDIFGGGEEGGVMIITNILWNN